MLGLIFLVILATGCASKHPGSEATSAANASKIPLKVSAKTLENPKGKSFQLLEITFENLSPEWVKISNADVIIADPSKSRLSVVMGKDLTDWAYAMDNELRLYRHNAEVAQGALVFGGSLLSGLGASNDSQILALAGLGAIIGGYTWAVSDTIRFAISSAEHIDKTPSTHLYTNFSIPGQMFQRRWVLINKPNDEVLDKLVLAVETVDGVKDNYEIKFH